MNSNFDAQRVQYPLAIRTDLKASANLFQSRCLLENPHCRATLCKGRCSRNTADTSTNDSNVQVGNFHALPPSKQKASDLRLTPFSSVSGI